MDTFYEFAVAWNLHLAKHRSDLILCTPQFQMSSRVIIDGVENPVEKPKTPAAQQITFSVYKNRNTAKTVVGVTPGGLITFVSSSYGGSASDRQIIECSEMLNQVEQGDDMADKSFDVHDLFAASDVIVNIPSCLSAWPNG
jgi:hypothetical protein